MTINPQDFVIDIPDLHPASKDYVNFWREQKRRSIEGYWLGGYYMPPSLYFYVNLGTIQLNKGESNIKTFARPWLRDLEWQVFRYYTACRGFSGFELDDEYSSHYILLQPDADDDYLKRYYPSTISSTGERKQFIHPRTNLEMQHPFHKGRALFYNNAWNALMVGSRDSGKSYSVGIGMGLKEWLFDGATSYDEKTIKYPSAVDITIGAQDSQKSSLMMNKMRLALERLPGEKIINGKLYPSPITKQYQGSWVVGKHIIAEYDKKYSGGWKKAGSQSVLKHRSFKDNPFADQGARNLLIVLEECFSPDTKVRMYNGDVKLISQLELNDMLMGEDNLPTYVKALWTGESELFKVKPKYADPYVVTGKHKLVLEQRCSDKSDGRKTLTPEEYNSLTKYKKFNTRHISSAAIEYPEVATKYDPYLYGLWIGDGKTGDRVIYNSDKEIIDYLYSNYDIVSDIQIRDTSTRAIRIKNLEKKDLVKKIIHKEYLINSISNRKKLLAGLVDSDGYLGQGKNKNSCYYEISCYKYLTQAIKELSKSLGYRVSIKEYSTYDRVVIRGNDLHTIPVKVERKKARKLENIEYNLSTIESIEPVGIGTFIGISLSKPLFLLEDYSVVHNCGMFDNLKQVFLNTRDNLQDGDRKIGSLIMLGTGGDMDGGTLDTQDMFYNPEAYDIFHFDDIWENRGKIGFFIPAYISLNSYKDEKGNTRIEQAKNYWLKKRETARTSSKGSEVLNKLIQYRPLVPSEMFLSRSSSIFPSVELQKRLGEIRDMKIYDLLEKRINLYFDPKSNYGGVNYEIDNSLNAINQYPWKEDQDQEGAVVAYELPTLIEDRVPAGAYVIGCDAFKANTDGGSSFAAIYVMKTNKYPSVIGYDEVVASYVGRPYLGMSQVCEILYKLSLFYGNAKIYFENTAGNIKDYFEKIKRLDLLAHQPTSVLNRKASYNTGPSTVYGYPMSNEKIKWEALQYVRTWLLQEREVTNDGKIKRNLDLLVDPYLIQQLIAFNMDGNFDAVMGFVGCVLGIEEMHHKSRSTEQEQTYNELDQQFINLFTQNKRLFYNQ